MRTVLILSALLACVLIGVSQVSSVPVPGKRTAAVELPERRPPLSPDAEIAEAFEEGEETEEDIADELDEEGVALPPSRGTDGALDESPIETVPSRDTGETEADAGDDDGVALPAPRGTDGALDVSPIESVPTRRGEKEAEQAGAEDVEEDEAYTSDAGDEPGVVTVPLRREEVLRQTPDGPVAVEKDDGPLPLPVRAPPVGKRRPHIAAEALGPPPPPETWPKAKIVKAKQQCDRLLNKERFDFEALAPIKKNVCGTPAPVSLKGFKGNSKVEINPAATITCPLAAAIDRWLREVVQPAAKEHLEDEIVALTNISSYHCRTRYNDPNERISYHAFAKALDVSTFVTAKGERISLIKDWKEDSPRSKFLKQIHAGACKIFGTVLGPEANAAHANHFHLDMAQRRYSAYCQ